MKIEKDCLSGNESEVSDDFNLVTNPQNINFEPNNLNVNEENSKTLINTHKKILGKNLSDIVLTQQLDDTASGELSENDQGQEIDDQLSDNDCVVNQKRHGAMLRLVHGLDSDKFSQKDSQLKKLHQYTEKVGETPFSLNFTKKKILKKEENIEDSKLSNGDQQLNISDIMQSFDDKTLSNQIEMLQKGKVSKKLDLPIHDQVQKEIDRKVAYDLAKTNISRWQDLVKQNREAEHIKFPLNFKPVQNDTLSTLNSKFSISNDFEKDFANLIQFIGNDVYINNKDTSSGNLENNEMTLDEVQEHNTKLKKMRSAIFYQDIKYKRAKKIKSKEYRRQLKKMRQKLEINQEINNYDLDLANELEDKKAYKRAEERMSLRHKNTGKQAKHLAKLKDIDSNAKFSIKEQLQIGQDLRKKIDSIQEPENSDGCVSDIDLEDMDGQVDDEKLISTQLNNKRGIFGLKFMQRAEEKRQRNYKQLLDEMEVENTNELQRISGKSDNNDDSSTMDEDILLKEKANNNNQIGIKKFGASSSSDKYTTISNESGDLNDITLKNDDNFDSSKSRVSGFVSVGIPKIDDIYEEAESDKVKSDSTNLIGLNLFEKIKDNAETSFENTPNFSKEENKMDNRTSKNIEAKVNQKNNFAGKNFKIDKIYNITPNLNIMKNECGDEIIEAEESDKDQISLNFNLLKPTSTIENSTSDFSQQELINKAFANSGAALEEFEKEKAEIIEKEAKESRKFQKETLPGQGSQAGLGTRPISKVEEKKKIEQEKENIKRIKSKRKDSKFKTVIINEKTDKKFLKYTLSEQPYPYTTKIQYERSLHQPVGREQNSATTFLEQIKPEMSRLKGTEILPITFTESIKQKLEQNNHKQSKFKKKAKAIK